MKSDAELAEWFKERLVWDNTETVIEMLKSGLFVRAYEPQVGSWRFVIHMQSCLLVPFVGSERLVRSGVRLHECLISTSAQYTYE